MRKLLNRPALALASVLALVFVIVLIKSYCKLIDDLTKSLSQTETESESDFASKSEEFPKSSQSSASEMFEPQLPNHSSDSIKDPNRQITLGTFEALKGSCFLHDGEKCDSFSYKNDAFSDLLDAITTHESESTDTKRDTILNLLDINNSDSDQNSLMKFYSEITRYRMYSNNRQTVDDLLYDMKTQNVWRVEEIDKEAQFKLKVTFDNDAVALFKPIRFSREQETLPNQMYFPEYERHTSEIAAFHLDRILGFRRAMPVIGRNMNMITEILRLADPSLQKTFFVSPKPDENLCFTGNCQQFCDGYHPICGNGTYIEGSLMAYLPEMRGSERTSKLHPWAQSYSKDEKAAWETDPDYCDKIVESAMYTEGRLLLELIDMSIFDFLIGNMDRQNFQTFDVFGNDTFTLHYDHGHAFGKAFHDELKILAPLLQCCLIRSSTLQSLLDVHSSPNPLSQYMRESLAEDPIAPILWEPHLEALDRRLIIVLQATRDCISRYSAEEVLVTKDSATFI
ncbi:extracellular serine/threonine protein CG31145-like [Sitodiplosis mosellana]|uniref:extracellular serine/threonine protein CG31145-like n=1 Tax=Sitodiplosis mosellana TaxID=263140 RepID=UPI0024439D64|nr:extracellular serine/threonine protein CG31145-like [Sitodiplosis mosellana]